MEISARAEYAIRAMLMLAEAHAAGTAAMPAQELAQRQQLPAKFLEVVLGQLRRAGLITVARACQRLVQREEEGRDSALFGGRLGVEQKRRGGVDDLVCQQLT